MSICSSITRLVLSCSHSSGSCSFLEHTFAFPQDDAGWRVQPEQVFHLIVAVSPVLCNLPAAYLFSKHQVKNGREGLSICAKSATTDGVKSCRYETSIGNFARKISRARRQGKVRIRTTISHILTRFRPCRYAYVKERPCRQFSTSRMSSRSPNS